MRDGNFFMVSWYEHAVEAEVYFEFLHVKKKYLLIDTQWRLQCIYGDQTLDVRIVRWCILHTSIDDSDVCKKVNCPCCTDFYEYTIHIHGHHWQKCTTNAGNWKLVWSNCVTMLYIYVEVSVEINMSY